MKKYLIILAAAVMALTGCKGGGNKYTSIKFKNAAVTIALGSTGKLQVLYEPTELEAPKCEWSSSNPEVVSVDQDGKIEGKAEGEANITAKCGDLTAVCKVTVQSIYDMLVWSDMAAYYDSEDPESLIGAPYEVEASNGTKYKVQKYAGEFIIFDDNVSLVSGEGFIGAGFCSFIDCPIEVIIEGQYAGYYWTNEVIFTNIYSPDSAGVCPEGELTDPEEWYTYLTDTTYKGDGSFKGAAIHYIDWDAKQEIDYLGFIKNGALGSYSNGFFYQMNITWLGGAYGLAVDEAGELVEPHKFAERREKYYEQLPEGVSAKHDLPISNKRIYKKPDLSKFAKDTKVFIQK